MRYQATAPPLKPKIKKKSGKTETRQAKTKIQEALEKAFPNSYIEKIHASPFKKGQPDFFGCLTETCPMIIESKKQGEVVTLLQKTHLNRMSRAGGVALAIWLHYDGSMSIENYSLPPRSEMVRRVADALGITKILSPGA